MSDEPLKIDVPPEDEEPAEGQPRPEGERPAEETQTVSLLDLLRAAAEAPAGGPDDPTRPLLVEVPDEPAP
ncbi:MAG: hypothetical protein ACRDHL_14730, partial [Candidatus Promineifilaceae bacterium]